MFPLNSNDQYIDSNGKRSTLGDAIGSGGGGEPYVLPTATSERLGGVKIGSGVNVSEDGTISVSGGGSSKMHTATQPFSSISGGWNSWNVSIPGEYSLSGCLFFVSFGPLSSSQSVDVRFTQLVSSLSNRTLRVAAFNQDIAGSIRGSINVLIIEP